MSDIKIKLKPFTVKEKDIIHKLVCEQNITNNGDSIIQYFTHNSKLFNKMITANFNWNEMYAFDNINDINEILKGTKNRQSYLKETDEAGNTTCSLILGLDESYNILKTFNDIDLKFFIDQENIHGQSPLFLMAKYNIKDLTKVINDGYVTKDKLMSKDIYGHSILFYIAKYHSKEFNKLLSKYKKSKKDNILKEIFGEMSIEEVLDMKLKKPHTQNGYSNSKKVEKEIDKLLNNMDVSISL